MGRDVYAAYLEWAMQRMADPDSPDEVKQRIGNTTAKTAVPSQLQIASSEHTLEDLLARSRENERR